MSLHHLAQHVQSAGRGDDKVLVHMTPKEVGGLQALAMAHGGSLTINPETGLPEAGFLSSLLPMIAGFALGPGGFALMEPMQAALTVGALGTAATGSLGKGLMMGLGAYGGAGLGAGLSSMGTTTPTAAVPEMNVATHGVEGMKAGLYGEGQGIFSQGFPKAATSAVTPEIAGVTSTGSMTGISASPTFDIGKNLTYTPAGMGAASTTIPSVPTTQATVEAAGVAPQTAMDKLGAGFKKATGSFQGLKDLYAASEAAAPYGGMAALGSTALGSYYDKLDAAKAPTKQKALIRPYEFTRTVHPEAFDVGAPIYSATPGSSASRQYFTDSYTALKPYPAPGPEYAAEGGLMGMAVGGPVETMSAMNAVGGNTMYPQAGLQTALYSNPMVQRPMPTNVISQGLDAPVDPYTGEQKFAGGGATTQTSMGRVISSVMGSSSPGYSYSYDPATQQYTELSRPQPASPAGPFNLIGRALEQGIASTPAKPEVSGGIAQPAVTPAMPAQPAYTPPPVPAYQTPEQQLGLTAFYPMMEQRLAALGSQGYAGGGLSHLGDYSDGGRLLKGPGDGVSDSIPAVIGDRQPARLADGEFVVPARIVSELGNGSTEAGARKLYAMMDRVQKARRKTVGRDRVAANTKAEKYLPA